MSEYERILRIINKWNPIDIHPLLYDKYISEVKLIHNFINEKTLACNVDELGQQVYSVFRDNFGKLFENTEAECEQIALLIIG